MIPDVNDSLEGSAEHIQHTKDDFRGSIAWFNMYRPPHTGRVRRREGLWPQRAPWPRAHLPHDRKPRDLQHPVDGRRVVLDVLDHVEVALHPGDAPLEVLDRHAPATVCHVVEEWLPDVLLKQLLCVIPCVIE